MTWLVCAACGHRNGCRIVPTSAVSCACCNKLMARPAWADADADDLAINYHRVNGGIVPTVTGQAKGYC